MKLAEVYSLSTGSSIEEPYIYTKYFPIPTEKFITIHNSSGMPSKNYDYWNYVLDIIWDYLKSQNYKVIQIGGKDDPLLDDVIDFRGKTDICQTAFILSKSLLHLSNDSFSVHVCGHFKVPLIALYGPTTANTCGPYWCDKSKTILIEADLKDKKPSWSREEQPKTINTIKPEDIAKKILDLLNGPQIQLPTSIYFGNECNDQVIECIPDQVVNLEFVDGAPNIRADYCFNPDNIYKQLTLKKSLLITDKALDINILKKLKDNIVLLAFFFKDENPFEFIKAVKKIGIPLQFITEKEDFNDLKLQYADYGIIKKITVPNVKELDFYPKIGDNTYFKTNRYILSDGKIYTSYAHLKTDQPIKSFSENEAKIIDDQEFWDDLKNYYIYNK